MPLISICFSALDDRSAAELQRQARAVIAEGGPLAASKPVVARYFNEQLVPEARGLKAAAMAGAELLYALDAAALAG